MTVHKLKIYKYFTLVGNNRRFSKSCKIIFKDEKILIFDIIFKDFLLMWNLLNTYVVVLLNTFQTKKFLSLC